jgi:gliding motility-associated-like protein
MKNALLFVVLCFYVVGIAAHNERTTFKFRENKGQLNTSVLFHNKLHVGDMFLERDRFTFNLFEPAQLEEFYRRRHGDFSKEYLGGNDILKEWNMHAYSMVFVGANKNATVTTGDLLDESENYFLGNDKSKWASDVHAYRLVRYEELYDNTDMEIYASFQNLKYDFIVHPGGDPNNIKIDYQGVDALSLEDGALMVQLSNGLVKELKPVSYQTVDGERVIIETKYKVVDKQVQFQFPNGYDRSKDLIVDPTWVFSTLTGSTADNWGFTSTYDSQGNLYAGSISFGAGYPVVSGSYQTVFGGGTFDISLSKFSADGTALLYSTYVGGTNTEIPHSMVVDSSGNLVVLATTSSSDFPVTVGSFDESFNGGPFLSVVNASLTFSTGSDMAIFRLNNAGTTLMQSTFLGGSGNDGLNVNLVYNYGDDIRGEVVVNDLDEVYIASSTLSTDFPTTPGSYSQTSFGGQDGVAVKLSSDLSTLDWGTYLGGTSSDGFYSLRVGSVSGDAYLCGGTQSTGLATTSGVIGPSYNGGTHDGFVSRLSGVDGSLIEMTYLGTTNYDQTFIIELDDVESVYTTGQSLGAWPVISAAFSNANAKQFIHKMSNDFATVDYSTVFGSGVGTQINISISAFLVDNCGNVYVSGWGGAVNGFATAGGTTTGMPVTSDAQQATTDGSDFYFFVMERDAASQLYGSFLGSNVASEHVDGGTSRFDKEGNVYQAVCAACGGTSFPTTPGVWSSVNGSANCNLGAIKFGFNFLGVEAIANIPSDILLCEPPYDVSFAGDGTVPNAFWDFGDGSGTSTSLNPTYTYADTGSYTVMYVAIDSSTCNISDTAYFNVHLTLKEEFAAEFDIPLIDPCEDNDSLLVSAGFTGTGADSLIWNMGDGTIYTNDSSIAHYYTALGNYIMSLTAYDLVCMTDTVIYDTIDFVQNFITVTATAYPNVLACDPPYDVDFTGGTPAPPISFWDFDDGSTSASNSPTHTFTDTGFFNIMYVAIDSNTCNIADTTYLTVDINQSETFSATLDFIPPPPCGMDTMFVNLEFTGTGADSLAWDMGDGTIYSDTAISHFYTIPGVYTISLFAIDTLCDKSETINNTLTFLGNNVSQIIVPNVFTPNQDGDNDEVSFSGVDPQAEYSWTIFNRWGKKVFESTDQTQVWDGTNMFNSSKLRAGIYFYELIYKDQCADEEHVISGYIHLMR